MTTKICCTCKQEKPIDQFSLNKSSKDGYKEYCKECASKKSALYRKTHSEKIKIAARKRYQESKEFADERTRAQEEKDSTKVCSMCGIEKQITDYYKCGNGGYRSYCKECANKKAREYYERNRDEIITQKRQYHKDHKEEISAYNRQYYNGHSDEIKIRSHEWGQEHPEEMKEHGVFYFHNNRSKERGIRADFTRGEWRECKEYFSVNGKLHCAYCGKELKKATIEHVVPFESGGEYTRNNIIPVCISCNASKGKSEMSEWYPKQSFYSLERENKIKAYLNQ